MGERAERRAGSHALVALVVAGASCGSPSSPDPSRLSDAGLRFFEDPAVVATAADEYEPTEEDRAIAVLFWVAVAMGQESGRAPELLSDPAFKERVAMLAARYPSLIASDSGSSAAPLIQSADPSQTFTCEATACDVDYVAVFGADIVSAIGDVAGLGGSILSAAGSQAPAAVEAIDDLIDAGSIGFDSASVSSYLATNQGTLAEAAADVGSVVLAIIGAASSGAVAIAAAVAGAGVTAVQIYVDYRLLEQTISLCNTWQSANCCAETLCETPNRCVRCDSGVRACATPEQLDFDACACGRSGESCCGSACGLGLECVASVCEPCGLEGQPCCAGMCDSGSALLCRDGTCEPDAGPCDISGIWYSLNYAVEGTPGETGSCRYNVDAQHIDFTEHGCIGRESGGSCVLENCPSYLSHAQLSADGESIVFPSTFGHMCIGSPAIETGEAHRCQIDVRADAPAPGLWTGSAWEPLPYTVENGCAAPSFAPTVAVPDLTTTDWRNAFDIPGSGCGAERDVAFWDGSSFEWTGPPCAISMGCPGLTTGPPIASLVFESGTSGMLRIETTRGCAFRSTVSAP